MLTFGQSPFAARMPARNYEALITILHKFPWYAVEHVLLVERDLIFDTTLKCMRSLMELLRQNMRPGPTDRTMPTGTTLHELTVAALTCPGFSEGQKAAIRINVIDGGLKELVSSRGMNFRFGGVDSFSTKWPFQALVKKPGVDDNLVKVSDTLDFGSSLLLANTVVVRCQPLPRSHQQG